MFYHTIRFLSLQDRLFLITIGSNKLVKLNRFILNFFQFVAELHCQIKTIHSLTLLPNIKSRRGTDGKSFRWGHRYNKHIIGMRKDFGLIYTCGWGEIKTHSWTMFFYHPSAAPLIFAKAAMGVYTCYSDNALFYSYGNNYLPSSSQQVVLPTKCALFNFNGPVPQPHTMHTVAGQLCGFIRIKISLTFSPDDNDHQENKVKLPNGDTGSSRNQRELLNNTY